MKESLAVARRRFFAWNQKRFQAGQRQVARKAVAAGLYPSTRSAIWSMVNFDWRSKK